MIDKLLRERFPFSDLTLENRATGGFEAPRLVRTAIHDLYPFYPDLLIFHVYLCCLMNSRRFEIANELIPAMASWPRV